MPQNGHSKSPYSTSVTGASGDPAAWSRAVTGCDRWSTCDAMDVCQPFQSRIMNKCNLACDIANRERAVDSEGVTVDRLDARARKGDARI
jgi:hypothetical protein